MVDKFKKYFSLLFLLFFAFGASAWGGFVTSIYKEPWYSTLVKPGFNPPDYIFPTIWIILYVSMAFAVWLIWINPKKSEKIIYIYFVHLLVNASWSFFCFASNISSIGSNSYNFAFSRMVNKIVLSN